VRRVVGFYLPGGAGAFYALIQLKDSLRLTSQQMLTITSLMKTYQAGVDSITKPLVADIIRLSPAQVDASVTKRVQAVAPKGKAFFLDEIQAKLRNVLTSEQFEQLPPYAKILLTSRDFEDERGTFEFF
jgi:hypothetical protein